MSLATKSTSPLGDIQPVRPSFKRKTLKYFDRLDVSVKMSIEGKCWHCKRAYICDGVKGGPVQNDMFWGKVLRLLLVHPHLTRSTIGRKGKVMFLCENILCTVWVFKPANLHKFLIVEVCLGEDATIMNEPVILLESRHVKIDLSSTKTKSTNSFAEHEIDKSDKIIEQVAEFEQLACHVRCNPAVARADVACICANPDEMFVAVYLRIPDFDGSVERQLAEEAMQRFPTAPLRVFLSARHVTATQNSLPEPQPCDSLDTQMRMDLHDVVDVCSETLFAAHSNLVGIAGLAMQTATESICVVAYVLNKGVRAVTEPNFPKFLTTTRGTAVRLRIDSAAPVSRAFGGGILHAKLEVLRPPCQLGLRDNVGYGTVGGFIEDKDQNLGLLTNAHVLFTKSEL